MQQDVDRLKILNRMKTGLKLDYQNMQIRLKEEQNFTLEAALDILEEKAASRQI